ncbi:UBP-type zinc finger domain-containing protein [Rhodococcus sp. IEGM 1379]|uniref:UBP-type zinc finger domain-containing protein n=1 Tax=Rhodococcus sp. IEGM 1379 TaxID=3047086 RepID=UPI0024B74BFA|nr:UBP-type zinc finger domain-containing protein [Rhodococcus sp. IEGM 1379]MDI9918899.1 UBP-type zinc finger domain-containing protein [Rhodococcus sp. IEGM 1379]
MKKILKRAASRKPAAEPAASGCAELANTPEQDPAALTPGACQECAELGEDTWSHLRICLSCGHVGCCDSSPHQHATNHFQETGHPVMRSHEPGESWRWCYVHNLMD